MNKTYQVKVLGGGCEKCEALRDNAQAALEALGSDERVEYITDMDLIRKLGLYMQTPVLMVGEEAVSKKKVLSAEEVRKLLEG